MVQEERRRRGFVTLQEAADVLGVSRQRMRTVALNAKLEVYEQPADRRVKLFRRADVAKLLEPKRAARTARAARKLA